VTTAASRAPGGRRQVTTRAEIETTAFALFELQGFEATTVDDIARKSGIGRRTFFRYFASKNDIVWGDWSEALDSMRVRLADSAQDAPLEQVLREAVVAYNRIEAAQAPMHRRRLAMILHVPALQAHSTIRYAEWRQVIAEFVAGRRGEEPAALRSQVTAAAALGAAVAAYEQWLLDPAAGSDELAELLDASLSLLASWARD
jgi:mycofactocin system transcriptional regulator